MRAALALGAAFAALAGAATAADPAIDYALECRGCHGADGSGVGEDVPDLRASLGRLVRAPGGRAYLVQVPGSSQAPLDDARLAAVLNWMLARFAQDDAGAAPFDAAEVARHRGRPLVEVERVRRRLLDGDGAAAR